VWHAADVLPQDPVDDGPVTHPVNHPVDHPTDGPVAEPPVDVVGAAVVDDLTAPTTLLAARRTEPPHLAGGWELPGGKVEPGEDPVAALHRELLEELGVEVELGEELPGPDPERPGWPLLPRHRMRVWMARVTVGVPAPIEDHDQVRLLGPGQWLEVGWLPADVPIVTALLARAGREADERLPPSP
jgi:8-oxo-dGTP diphosphatase